MGPVRAVQHWFVVFPTAVYEITAEGRVLCSWAAHDLFGELVVAGYPATVWPNEEGDSAAETTKRAQKRICYLDLLVEDAAPRSFSVTARTSGPSPTEARMPAEAAAVFEYWYRLHL
jgi:hypothetical protein